MYSVIYSVVCLVMVLACVPLLGRHMARVYTGDWSRSRKIYTRMEQGIFRLCGIDAAAEMGWREYAFAILSFSVAGFLLLFAIFLAQGVLPLNPQGAPGLPTDLAFNAAIAFITNADWQSYSGEVYLSYFSQMCGVTVQNFLSAAVGLSVGAALARGLARKQAGTLGNAYVDVVRSLLFVLLPLAFVFALFFASQGVIGNLSAYTSYTPVQASQESTIAQGPVASQLAIKVLGSNGGGFFNVNSAHPFENPTPLSNLLQIVALMLIPVSFAYTFGLMVGDRRQGIVLIAAMFIIFIPMLSLVMAKEHHAGPKYDRMVMDTSLGNMEGKETRFGVTGSAMWAAATTATSNGSTNSMHDSYTPLGGLVPLMLIQFEVIFGGVGSGVYGMVMFVLLTVFIGGLMVGRTPEYLGKKLGPFEIKMASVVMVLPGALMLAGTAIACVTEAGRAGVFNPGAQGFSEILYAFASASNNNGSAFAGLSANTPFYNVALAVCMFIGRYWLIIPVLAIAGSLAAKNPVPPGAGTLPTHTPLFTVMLCFIILLNLLTYLPSLALGPVVEYLHSVAGGV